MHKKRNIVALEKKMVFDKVMSGGKTSHAIIFSDRDIDNMRQFAYNREYRVFFRSFKRAYKCYLLGAWTQAQQCLQTCLRYFPNDGPTNSILEFIEKQNLDPPSNWKGCRALAAK